MGTVKLENEVRELKTALIEEAKEKSAIDAQRKALIAENNELKTQLSSLKTESSASKLSLQAKINELITKTEAQAKEMSLLEVSDRKGKKALAEMQKQVADLMDIKKRHQIAQTENAAKIDTEIKEKTTIANDLRRLKEETKEAKLKLETETNARNKAEMELDNCNRRLASQEVDFKNKHLSIVKEMTGLVETRKKLETQNSQLTKKLSDMEITNKQLQVRLKEVEKKLNSAYRLSTIPKVGSVPVMSGTPLTPSGSGILERNSSGKKKKIKDDPSANLDLEYELENSDEEDMELAAMEQSSGPIIPPESADVLVIGNDKLIERIIAYLQQKKHKATNVNVEDAMEALLKKRYQIVLCWGKILPEILSLNGTSFLEVFKKHNNGVPFLSFSLTEGVDNIVKQLTNSNGESSAICELVKSQLTCFLQTIWVNDQLKGMSDSFEKEKELLLVSKNNSSIAKLEDDLRQLEAYKRKADKESLELKGIVSKLVEEKGKRETEVDTLKKKVSALCSKIFLLELEAQPQAQQAALASSDKFDLKELKEESEKAVTQVVGSFNTPIQSLTRLIILLLKDDRTKELRPYLEAILNSLSMNSYHDVDFNEFFAEAGIDTLTQSWMLYEFARGKLVNRGSSGRAKLTPSPSGEYKLPDIRDRDYLVENWQFDPHIYSQDELFTLYIYMLEKLGIFDTYDIPKANLINFCRAISKNYRKNPYHNFQHAFDVAQMCFKLVYKTKAMEYLTTSDLLILLLSALCHDTDHPGLNNNFQINDNTHLALIYNDQSVLENHHASRSFYIMNTPENNIFANFDEQSYREVRKGVVTSILATDMAQHFELMSKFTTHLNMQPFSNKNADSRQLLLNVILHIADISNVSRPWDIAKRWSDLVLEEFLHQGDLEKEKDLLISPYMDRNNTDQPKMSLGFIDYMVLPMFTALKKILPEINEAVETIHKNRAIWAERAENEITVEQVMEDFKRDSPSPESERSDSTPRSNSSDGKSRRGTPTPPKKAKPPMLKSHSLPGKQISHEHESELVKINTEKKKKSNLPVINGR